MKNKLQYIILLIPFIGFFYSIFLIISGLINRLKLKILFGVLGIFLNGLVIYLALNSLYNSEQSLKSRVYIAKTGMKKVEKFLELYKLKYKQYPDSIEQLNEFESQMWCVDPFAIKLFHSGGTKIFFNYSKKDTGFVLFSVGRDKNPNTSDDVFFDKNFIDTTKNEKIIYD